jgi:hypothetical protein
VYDYLTTYILSLQGVQSSLNPSSFHAQIILIGAREGKDTLRQELGITVENESKNDHSADIFTTLNIRKDQVPIKPLIQGKLE